MNKFDLSVQHTYMLTPNIIHIALKRNDGIHLDFTPGQFVTFIFENEVTGKPIRRSYSISSIPGETDNIEIAVSPVAEGFATNIFFNLHDNQILPCSGPFGRLVLKDNEQPEQYVLVATGTGVSPYRAMLPTIARRLTTDENIKFTLLLGVQHRQDLLYLDDFINFAKQYDRFQFRAYLSRETELQHDYEYRGYVQHAFSDLNLNPEADLIYLCGNPNMIDDAFAILQEKDFPTKSVRREKYISAK
jgi:ferredoxin-NADP reductase